MENEGGARLLKESSQAPDLASLNLIESKGLEPKSRDGIRDEWLKLEVSYSEIRDITANFSEDLVIGEGGFGKVYQAKLDGQTVAIKILDSTSKQGEREFFREIEVLYKLQHRNLVKLIGACFEVVKALIYEYLPHGSLEDCLEDNPEILTWQLRTRIIYEICLALSYLHSKSVVHADLKPANVLLNASFKSKLSDFGLCRFLPENMITTQYLETKPMGTLGYMDPWFLKNCILRSGSDLYSLGVIILRLLTRMSPIELAWQIRVADENSLRKMIDSTAGNWPFELAKDMVYWSLQCCFHNENSSEVLMGVSNFLKRMLADIDTLKGERFEPRQTIQDGSGGLEPPSSLKEDINEVMGASYPSSSSSFSEPRQTIQDGSGELEPPSSRKEDKNEVMGATNPSSSSSFSEIATTRHPRWMIPSEPSTSIDTQVEERDGEKLVQFHGSPFIFRLDDGFSSAATWEWMGDSLCWRCYRVTLKDGNKVDLKTIRAEFAKGQTEFEKEANALEIIRHPNLLAVRGYYIGAKGILKMSLVFEFLPRGSLYFRLNCDGGGTKIDWATRMNVAVAIARGLDYIHNDVKVIHGNLTSHNIHLDDDYNAKISDYELSCFATCNMNCCTRSLCYRAPELISSGLKKTNTKSDVYSLGVILLELLTGKNPCTLERGGLEKSVALAMEAEKPSSVLAKDLVSDALGVTNEQVAALLLALDCVKLSPGKRPEVKRVLHKLEEIKVDVDAGGTSYSAHRRRRWWSGRG